MSLSPAPTEKRPAPLTPGSIATEFSKMDFPAPSNLKLHLPKSPISPGLSSAMSGSTDGDITGPEPEAISVAKAKKRSESMSEQLSTALAGMNFPQPERIFGPEDAPGPAHARNESLPANAWDTIVLNDDVPEAVKEPARMTHSRHTSRVEPSMIKSPTIPEEPSSSASVLGATVVKEQKITPFDVEGAVDADGKEVGIDYNKLVRQFGAAMITDDLLARFEQVTGHRPHPLMRRGTFFSHRDFHLILDRFEKGQPFYLYTGRGPSSDSMHMGHLIPFMFTAWLQKVFNCPLVIQITDDEKYLLERDIKKQAETMKKIKGKKPIDLLRHYKRMARDNIKDIIACGFIPEKTYIFQDTEALGGAFYNNVVLMSKTLTLSKVQGVFGFGESDNVGMYHFAAIQATPSFSNSWPQIFGERDDIPCLIPCAIDQDPYFLLTRDSADRLGYKKPALLHAKFLPALQGSGTKMSASNENSAIFMTDDAKKIHKKIRSHAYSGGRATQEEHQRLGGDVSVDIAYLYLGFFEDDDAKMEQLAEGYGKGTISTVQMKDECIAKLQSIVGEFQRNRAAVSDDQVSYFLDAQRKIDPRPVQRATTTATATA